MPRSLKITRTVEPQTVRVWADRVTTAPLHFGIDPARLQWHQQAPGTREDMEAEAAAIKAIAEQASLSAWKQPRPLPVLEIASAKNQYLLVGNRDDYRTLRAIKNAKHRPVVALVYTVSKNDLGYIDFKSLLEKAA